MKLTEQQSNVIKAILSAQPKNPVFIGGYAGTGKTTTMRGLLEHYGPEKLLFLAPTGKACQVLRSKMPEADVRTIHSALYVPEEISKEELALLKELAEEGDEDAQRAYDRYKKFNVDFHLKSKLDLKSKIVIVDEASMVQTREFDNLLDACSRIAFIGDPAQLPPVNSPSILPDTIGEYDAFLTDVHRAALESPITRLAMAVRENEPIRWKEYICDDIAFLDANVSVDERIDKAASANQILVYTNNNRRYLNNRIRMKLYGKDLDEIHEGEKVIVTKTAYYNGNVLAVNGDMATVASTDQTVIGRVELDFIDSNRYCGPVWQQYNDRLLRRRPSFDDGGKDKSRLELDYAYAITIHKSQGSEWDDVALLTDYRFNQSVDMKRKLMYTAITRAKNRLTVISHQGI